MTAGGSNPGGASPAGAGLPVPGAPLADKLLIDKSGNQANAVYINPTTGRYEFDANGRVIGMNGIQQEVLLALKTVLDSSVVGGFGHSLASVKDFTSDVDKRVDTIIREALQHLVTDKKISIESVVLTKLGTSRGMLRVTWRDLVTGNKNITAI